MGIGKKILKGVGVVQGEIPTRGPIAEEELLEIKHILQKYLLVDHLTLMNPLGVQALHLIGVRGRGITRTIHMEYLSMNILLHLMVRKNLVKKMKLVFWG